jgi:hypothetical protein
MDRNLVFAIVIGTLAFVFSICVLVGNFYLSKIIFTANTIDCSAPTSQLIEATADVDYAKLLNTIAENNYKQATNQLTAGNTLLGAATTNTTPITKLTTYTGEALIIKNKSATIFDTSNAFVASANKVIDAMTNLNTALSAPQTSFTDANINKAKDELKNAISDNITKKDNTQKAINDLDIVAAQNAAIDAGTTYPPLAKAPPPPTRVIDNAFCSNVDKVQIGFARLAIVFFWFEFPVVCVMSMIAIFKLLPIMIIPVLALLVSILVGGIYLAKFAFFATTKVCSQSIYYCYDIDNTQIGFSRLTSLICWIQSFAVIIGIFIYLQTIL